MAINSNIHCLTPLIFISIAAYVSQCLNWTACLPEFQKAVEDIILTKVAMKETGNMN